MSLRPTNYEEACENFKPMRRTSMRSRTSPSSGNPMKRGKKRLGPGKKTKAWDSARAIIKKRFEKVGITTCELRGIVKHDCKIDDWLSFAHDAKRRKLRPEDLSHVILCCTIGHDIIEVWTPEKMKAIVNETIRNRKRQP